MISIVTPVYNAINFIDDTIDMVIRQDYGDWELILVEDGSTDGTRQKLAAMCGVSESADSVGKLLTSTADSRIHVVLLPPEEAKGAAGARNRGVDEAKGRYIAFLDADDVWMPNKLSKQLEYMEKSDAGFTFTSYEFGDEEAHPTGRVVRVPQTLTYKEALSRTVIFTTTTMFDTTKIDRDLLHMPLVASEDTATWWRILRNGHLAYGLDEVLAIYRRPAHSLSSNKLEAIKRIWNLYRREEQLNVISSAWYFVGWAFRATARRL